MSSNVEIKLLADISDALKGISSFTKTAETAAHKFSEGFVDAAGEIKHALLGIAAGFSLEKIVEAGLEAEKAIKGLEGALLLAGDAVDPAPYEKLATEIKNLIGVDDELVLQQATFLKTLGASNKQIDQAIKVAAQMSTVFGEDLGTSVRKTAAVLSGELPRGISKFIPELKTLDTATKLSASGLDVIQAKLGNLAGQLQTTGAIQLNIFKENLHNIVETLGLTIVSSDLFKNSLKFINDGLEKLNTTLKELSVKDVAEGFTRVAVAIGSIIAVSKFQIIVAELAALKTAFVGLEIGVTAAKIAVNLFKASATLGLTLVLDQLVKIGFEAESVGQFFEILGLKLKVLFLSIADTNLAVLDSLLALSSKIPGVGKVFGAVDSSVKGLRESFSKSKDEAKQALKAIESANSNVGKSSHEASKSLAETADNGEKLRAVINKTAKDAANFLGALNDPGLKKFGVGEQVKAQLKELDELRQAGRLSEQQYADARVAIAQDAADKIQEINKKSFGSIADLFKNGKDLNKQSIPAQSASIAFGVVSDVTKGFQGALKMASQMASVVGEALLPGFGQVIGGLIEFLGQSPEQLKAAIQSFFDALPTILENIAANIGNLIIGVTEGLNNLVLKLPDIFVQVVQSLIDKLPQFIAALAAQAPFLMIKFSNALIAQAPQIAIGFTVEFIKQIPNIVSEFGKQLANSVKEAFSSLGGIVGGGGGGGGGILGSIGGIFGFNKGGVVRGYASGGIVAGGAPFVDKVPALLTPGEAVISRDTVGRLDAFLQKATGGGGDQTVHVTLQLGENELASTIFNLNKQGFRLA